MVKRQTQPVAEDPQRPVVDDRGQMLLYLEGGPFILRPSRLAIANIERQLRPLHALALDARNGILELADMAIITAEMMRAFGKANPEHAGVINYTAVNEDRLADLIYEAGIPSVCGRLFLVLTGALGGGYTAEGEAKRTEDKIPSPPPSGA